MNMNALRWQRLICLLIYVVCTSRLQLVLSGSPDLNTLPDLPKADADLFDALKEEDVEAAAKALEAGANINALSPRGQQTPLMQSVLHGRTKMVEWCLNQGERAMLFSTTPLERTSPC